MRLIQPKLGLVILGAIVAVSGILLIDGRRQATETERSKLEDAMQKDRVIADRMADFRRQYLITIETVPILIFTSPQLLTGRAGRASAILAEDRIRMMVVFSCASADSSPARPSTVIQRCEDKLKTKSGHYSNVVDTLKTRDDLLRLRVSHGVKRTGRTNLRYFAEQRRLEEDMSQLETRSGKLRAQVGTLQSWQNVFAVLGIIIALGKDVFGDSKPTP